MMSDKSKDCPPKMVSWGIGQGVPPLTTDPENPFKPFATYQTDEDKDEVPKTPQKRS